MFHDAFDVEDPDIHEEDVSTVVDSMKIEVDALMAWLDWTQAWDKCRPGCSVEVRRAFVLPVHNTDIVCAACRRCVTFQVVRLGRMKIRRG